MKEAKSQLQILQKLGIEKLNPMQNMASSTIRGAKDVVLLSPTGSGKTLAFLLPLLQHLDPSDLSVQLLILVPSRELALQIEQVCRAMGAGFKVNAVYGGRPVAKDKMDLKHLPSILIGTPGRVADHIRRGTFAPDLVRSLVLDEFDKSLEIGFELEMREIIESLVGVKQRILTSATQQIDIPSFVGLKRPEYLDFLEEAHESFLEIKRIMSATKDKLETLAKALCHLGNKPGIIFCNFKDSIKRISEYLSDRGISHGCFYGGMEQIDRELALIKFRNGSHQLLLATDLAARGIDVPEIKFIIHYHFPIKIEEFTHRNGRTARMQAEGSAYIIQSLGERLPDYLADGKIDLYAQEDLLDSPLPERSPWTTLMLSGGRKDKISKGDIVGLFLKKGGISSDDLGIIELKTDRSFVSIKRKMVGNVIIRLNAVKLKQRKIKLQEI